MSQLSPKHWLTSPAKHTFKDGRPDVLGRSHQTPQTRPCSLPGEGTRIQQGAGFSYLAGRCLAA